MACSRLRLGAKRLLAIGLAIGTGLFVFITHIQSSTTQELVSHASLEAKLPGLSVSQPHPLPSTLNQWQDATNAGDYFSQVKPTTVGYLVWSQFPIKVYVEPADGVSSTVQAQKWVKAVLLAVQEWNKYLPLQVIQQPEVADITIWRSRPPLKPSQDGNIPRARSAETRYELYLSSAVDAPNILSHRCIIRLSPTQIEQYLQAGARHELGHALGIWGHSPVATDVMYFSQVRNPPPISPRDLNTLKQVYQQPTRLGWPEKNSEFQIRNSELKRYKPLAKADEKIMSKDLVRDIKMSTI